MQLTNALILAGALSVSAHPSARGHAHRHIHEKKDVAVETFIKYVHETTTVTVDPTTETPAPAPVTSSSSSIVETAVNNNVVAASTTTNSPAPAVPTTSSTSAAAPALPTPSASSSSSSGSSGAYKAFCGGSSKRATYAQVNYKGNTGTTYGCNIMEVDSSIADLYNYTMAFTNVDSSPYEIICWNKIGSGGGTNGFFKGKGEAVTINLAAGSSAYVAFEANSQGACAFGKGAVQTSTYGEYAGTWAEFDFANTSNDEWSGADLSLLVADTYGLAKYGGQMCYAGTCSTTLANGSGTNAYLSAATQTTADGIGLNIPPGNVHITVSVGYSG